MAPFGHVGEREQRDRERRAELNAKYRAEQKRQNAKWEFEQFCKAQRERIAKRLQQASDRVNRARWGTVMDGDGFFAITKHGTTEASSRVRREYQDQ